MRHNQTKRSIFIAALKNVQARKARAVRPVNLVRNMKADVMTVAAVSALKDVIVTRIKPANLIADGKIRRARARKIAHLIPIHLLQNCWR